jgi:RimJ/RimL family protein N-acetyltransferase
VPLSVDDLMAMLEGDRDRAAFTWPGWWPDDVDRHHLELWLDRAKERPDGAAWGPRAVVESARGSMVGHAGFHRPPQSLADALSDPSFEGARTPAAAGAVEIGYTIFSAARRRGYASEAVAALVGWAMGTGQVSTVIASVAEDNAASHGVLRRVGGFQVIGTCRGDDETIEIVYRCDGA